MLLAALTTAGAYAQTNRLYIPDLTMSRGAEAMVSVYMDNSVEVTAVEFTLSLPTGFTLTPSSAILTDRAKNHQVTARRLSNGNYKFVVMSQSNALIEGIAGQLFTFRLQATSSVTDEHDYPLTMTNAVMSVKSGQNMLDAAEGGTIRIKSMPNLHVTAVDCSEAVAGQTMTVHYIVKNDGRAATGDTEWNDYIWLTPNITAGTAMFGAKLLKTVGNVSALQPGESYENTVNVVLEERIYGNYDIVITSNMYGVNSIDFSATGGEAPAVYEPATASYGFLKGRGNASYITVAEEGEVNGISDNFSYRRIDIQVPPLADIQVPKVVIVVDNESNDSSPSPINSAGLASSNSFYSGKTVKVTATIANKGETGIYETLVKNELYMSNTPDLNDGKVIKLSTNSMILNLQPEETVFDVFSATIPYDWFGDTYFIVKADVDDRVYELANTENNSGVSNLINVLLTPGADFEPYNLNVPSVISSNKPFDITYAVRNVGAGIPYKNYWTDNIYISTKNTGLDGSATLIAGFRQNGTYKNTTDGSEYIYNGDNYSSSRRLSVNNLQEGTYYIYVKTDANDDVFEYDGEDNNVVMSGGVRLEDPDLIVELISLSEEKLSTGQTVAVTWKLKNTGQVDISNATVKDGFYAAANASGSNAISLGSATNTISIVAGGEKTLRTNITIPEKSSLNGNRYFYVKTNIGNTVKESSTSNNMSTPVQKQFVYVQNPEDVQVNGTSITLASLTVASTATPGQSLSVSYRMKNNGTLMLEKNVSQEIYYSTKNEFDSSAKKLNVTGTLPDVSGLQAGQTVTANVTVTVPTDMKGGQYFLYVCINKDKALKESNYNDNEKNTPLFINGNLPNLAVGSLSVPATIRTSETTEISWTVSNQGSWDAGTATCVVYLSSDAVYDKNDKQLASVNCKALAKGASETMKTTVELDDNVVGSHYIIVAVNASGEETNTDDNHQIKQFTAVQAPLPDLAISGLTAEGIWRGGQTATLTATVTNNGDDDTHKDKWADVFYLSEGYTLDVNTAIKLGAKTHTGNVAKDGSYTITAQVKIPETARGNYVLFAVVDGNNVNVEKRKDNNTDKVVVYVEDKSDRPSDLVVKDLNVPARITAGEAVTLSYAVANQGEYMAKGTLRDVLYMSTDSQWDEDDPMVGVVTGEVSIAPGTEISRSVTGRVTNMPEGNYYLIVRTNSTHNIAEVNYDNNQIVEKSSTTVNFATLSLGSSVTVNTSGLFRIPTHSGLTGKTFGIYLTTPENTSAGLYSAFESVPSTARYERTASDIEATKQELLIPDVQEGDYYVLAQDNTAVSRSLNEFVIDGEQELTETTMTLSAREVLFGASSLSITEGGKDGWISTEIHGALLDSIMDFRLSRENEYIPAESITFYDQTATKTTFNLKDAALGSYDVISELPDGTVATLPDGFRVVPGTNVALGVKLEAPEAVRVDGYGPVTVAYANGGNTDIVIRELLLTIDGGQLGTTIQALRDNPQRELHIKPDVKQDNRGFVVIPPGKQETVNYYFLQTAGSTYMNLYIVK